MSRLTFVGPILMSYRTTNWGYTKDAPLTEDPVRLSEVDEHLTKLGYKMWARTDLTPPWYPIQFDSRIGSDPISLPPPYYRAEGMIGELVYDRQVIEDHLSRLGVGGIDEDGHEVQAKKKI